MRREPEALIKFFGKLLPENEPVSLAQRLVRFPTENPPGNEAGAIEHLAEVVQDWGFETELLWTDTGRVNLVARLGWGNRSRRILFNGHLDVVPSGDQAAWTREPFEGKIADGRLWGRGAADMKGGVAAMLWAARLIQLSKEQPHDAEIVFHLVSDEETGGTHGAKFLVDHGLARADAAVVGEPTGLNVVVASKGAIWSRLNVKGKSAHGSIPHLGENAIERMADLILRLGDMPLQGEHPLLGPPTINLGTITGGSKINMVPDRCVLEVDRRVLPGESRQAALGQLTRLVEEFRADTGVEVDLEEILYASGYEIDPAEKIVQAALRAAEAVTGEPKEPRGARGFTDARFYFLEAGIPTIILGPGSISQAHAADEFVEIEQLRLSVGLYALIISRFLSGSG
ncbi:MAG: M20 family metallopeptidase [Proteobacteria bacterium]|nr:M20 family metallopeptidase [Pseudomonadota bacterium]MBU1740295.1 M20 family metallopeptidase [Pseudomonadota bacterium]